MYNMHFPFLSSYVMYDTKYFYTPDSIKTRDVVMSRQLVFEEDQFINSSSHLSVENACEDERAGNVSCPG
jgi:hypothetical protein